MRNPVEYNELMVNFSMRVHEHCMDSVLYRPEAHKVHDYVRSLLTNEINRSATDAQRFHHNLNLFNVACPVNIRVANMRALLA